MAAQFRPRGNRDLRPHVTTRRVPGPHMPTSGHRPPTPVSFRSNRLMSRRFRAYGVVIADASRKPSREDRHQDPRRDQLNPKEAVTRRAHQIKSLKPDLLYYGGLAQAGGKARQAAYIHPHMPNCGGLAARRAGRKLPQGRGFPRDGWYCPTPRRTCSRTHAQE